MKMILAAIMMSLFVVCAHGQTPSPSPSPATMETELDKLISGINTLTVEQAKLLHQRVGASEARMRAVNAERIQALADSAAKSVRVAETEAIAIRLTAEVVELRANNAKLAAQLADTEAQYKASRKWWPSFKNLFRRR